MIVVIFIRFGSLLHVQTYIMLRIVMSVLYFPMVSIALTMRARAISKIIILHCHRPDMHSFLITV